jgi:hypothetical protein
MNLTGLRLRHSAAVRCVLLPDRSRAQAHQLQVAGRSKVVREANLHVTHWVGVPAWIGSLAIVEAAAPEPIGPVLVVHHKPT